MKLAAMLIGLALLFAGVLVLSLFVPHVGGGSAFEYVWPYLTGLIVALLSAAMVLADHARRRPDAWLHQSVWPKAVMALVVSAIALLFAWALA
jgi:H+/Cl- antiporter ClcA